MEKRAFLGNNISLLGFGIMRLPMVQGTDEIDVAQVTQMVDTAIKSGINYFDTAYPYHGGKSERVLKEVLVDRYDRSQYFLADKMPVWEVNEYADFDRLFNIQLERTGVDYFDFYLLHALSQDRHEKHGEIGMYRFMQELKASGRVKHIGFSFHDKPDALRQILTDQPEMEFVQLQINYLDWDAIGAGECYDIATEMGKPVIVMEPVKGGTLANLSAKMTGILTNQNPTASPASWALRYTAGLDNVMTVLSGMSSLDQMNDNIGTLSEFSPLNEEEIATIEAVKEEYNKIPLIPCTFCQYCKECPQNIEIPRILSIYNDYLRSEDLDASRNRYNEILEAKRADQCIHCGLCVEQCPQSIAIPEELEKIAACFK